MNIIATRDFLDWLTQKGTTHRIAVLEVSADLFVSFLQAGNVIHCRVVRNGLPEDAKVVACDRTTDRDYVVFLMIESAAFDVVGVGETIPVLPPVQMERVEGTPQSRVYPPPPPRRIGPGFGMRI